MMICHCTLGGTKACEKCSKNVTSAFPYIEKINVKDEDYEYYAFSGKNIRLRHACIIEEEENERVN